MLKALELLKEIEWEGGKFEGDNHCPICYRYSHEGHNNGDCKLAEAIKKLEELNVKST